MGIFTNSPMQLNTICDFKNRWWVQSLLLLQPHLLHWVWPTPFFTPYLGHQFDFSGQQSLNNLLFSSPLVSVIINFMILYLWHIWTHHNPLHPTSQDQLCFSFQVLWMPIKVNHLWFPVCGWEAGRFDRIPEDSRIGQAWVWIPRVWGN